MKKTAFLVLAVMLMGATASQAAQTGAYDDIKAIKAKQREAREADRAARKSGSHEPTKMEKFWKSEGERSGLGNTGNNVGNFFKNLNPAPFFAKKRDEYNARNAGGAK